MPEKDRKSAEPSALESDGYDFDEDEIAAGDAATDKAMRASEEFRLRDPQGWVAQQMKDFKALVHSASAVTPFDVNKAIAEAEANYRRRAAEPPSQKQPAAP